MGEILNRSRGVDEAVNEIRKPGLEPANRYESYLVEFDKKMMAPLACARLGERMQRLWLYVS